MGYVMYIVTSVIIILTWLIKNYLKNKPFWDKMDKFKGDYQWPLIGHAGQFGLDTLGIFTTLERMFNDHGQSTFKVIIGNKSCYIMLCDPETIEIVLGSNKEIVKSLDYDFFIDWLGDGLLLANGNKWRRQRKIITPTFHFKILENFVGTFNTAGGPLIKKLKESKGEVFNVHNLITLYTLDVICESAMGVAINAQEKSDSDYVKAIYRECELLNLRSFSVWKRFQFLYQFSEDFREHKKNVEILHHMTKSVIKSRKIAMKDDIEKIMSTDQIVDSEEFLGRRKKVAFLDLLLMSKQQDGTPLPDESIREEVDTFMFEGHDTTSTAISFALYELANNPDTQQKAFEEQQIMFGNDLSVMPSYNDLQNMKYLECVIKEALRMYPSVPFFARRLQEDTALPDGTVMPAGSQVTVNTYLLGRNPKHYPNPQKFDPERFSPENTQKKHAYWFCAFSAGPRNCIGQKFAMLEMKSVLSKILRNIELLPAGPGYDLKLVAEVILKSKSGVNIRARERVHQK